MVMVVEPLLDFVFLSQSLVPIRTPRLLHRMEPRRRTNDMRTYCSKNPRLGPAVSFQKSTLVDLDGMGNTAGFMVY